MIRFLMIACLLFSTACSWHSSPDTASKQWVPVYPNPTLPTPLPHLDYNLALEQTPSLPNVSAPLTLVIQNPNDTAALYSDFKVVHSQRLQLYAIDAGLRDYHDLHPIQDRKDSLAIYTMMMTPQQSGRYFVYAEVNAIPDAKPRILSAEFTVRGNPKPPVFESLLPGNIQSHVQYEDLIFDMQSVHGPIYQKKSSLLNITVKNQAGQLFRRLEPTSYAFARLVGFNSVGDSVRAQPIGEAVAAQNARGGPNLMFDIVFPTSGYYRLFLHVKIDDQLIVIPIDVNVAIF